jgi:hypothetical protein
MTKIFLAVLLAAFALVAPASAAAETPTFVAATFVTTLGARSDVDLDLTISPDNAAPAKIVIYVPQGFSLNTGASVGSAVGSIDVHAVLGGNPLTIPTGTVVADNPASYTANPQAQACAPGTHAAVWVAHVATFIIPIYVDATSGAESTIGAYKLQICLTAPQATSPQVQLTEAELNFIRTVLTNPSTPADYLWRVFVTPYVSGTSTPNPSGTYELRGADFIPAVLTFKESSYNKKKHQAVLTGRLLLIGKPVSGIPVYLLIVSAGGNITQAAHANTNKKGTVTFRRPVKKTTKFAELVPPLEGPCGSDTPTTAPGGCLSETTTPFFSNTVTVVPKK